MPDDTVYSESAIQQRLAAELPGWSYQDGHIQRRYQTSGWKSTLMAVNAIGHLAEAAWHHPELTASYARVEVRLATHSAAGVTDKDFELARKIEETLLWRPGAGSALEGTPQDPRFAYLIHDSR